MISANTMVPIAHVHVRDRDYTVFISMCTVTRHMHIFKYDDLTCEYEVFTNEQDACAWLNQYLGGNEVDDD